MAQVPATQRNQGSGLAARREHPLERLHRDFETLFERLWGGWFAPSGQDFESMRVWDFGVTDNDKEIVVRAELPGFEEKEVDIQLNNDVLTIKAEKEQKGDGQEEYRSFHRSVMLPAGVDAEKAQATYHNGVLELHLPKMAGSQARHIAVGGKQNGAGQQAQSGRTGNGASETGNQGEKARTETGASQKGKK